MKTRLIRAIDHSQLFTRACDAFFDTLRRFSDETIVIGLPGGRSIMPFLDKLAEKQEELEEEVWRRLEFFMLDERVVPLDHEDSNFGSISEHLSRLVSGGKIAVEQLHPFIANFELKDFGTKAYAAELQQFGGKFHVALLGVGEDAHVGALFPDHHSMSDESPYFITMEDSPKPPGRRMSSSRALISCSERIFALFIGEGKRNAIRKFFDARVKTAQCPVKLINAVKESFIITDLNGTLID
jgi:6-phosphogluconolactonase